MKTMWQNLMGSTAMMSPPDVAGSGGGGVASGGDGAAPGGGAPPVDGASGGGSPTPPVGGGQPDGGGPAATPYRPEGLPDHLAGPTDKDTIDRLFKTMSGFRQAQGDAGAVPKSPADYKLDFGDKLKPFAENFDKDPLFKETLSIAHQAGIPDKQFNKFLPKLLEHMIDSGMVAAPVDPVAELMKLAPAEAAGLDEAGRKAAASRRLNDNIAWADTMKGQFGGDDARMPAGQAFDWLAAQATDNVNANYLIEFMRGKSAEPRPALDGGRKAGGANEDALIARMKDPRGDPNSTKFEQSFADETDRLSRQFWG